MTGLTRLASRSKSRREDSVAIRKANLPMSEVQLATFAHIGIVKDVVSLHFKNLVQVSSKDYLILQGFKKG